MLQVSRRKLLASTAAMGLCAASPAGANKLRGGPSKSAWSVAFTLNNLDPSRRYSTPNVSYGHAFADGDVPAGGSVAMTDSNGNAVLVQMDAVALWPSGCPRFAVLSHSCTESFGPGASKTYTIASSAASPDNTPAAVWGSSPEATMASNTDFAVTYSGFDALASTYTVSLNAIFSTYPNFPWGTHYPLGGWERTKVGPACIEWHAWQYLINDATARPQGYVRCDIWIKAWSPTGPFEIDVRTSQPNMWNAISESSERRNRSPGRWATLCVVKNGSTIVQNAGGPGDYRTTRIPRADFDTATSCITAAAGSLFPQQGIVFASTGTLPSGISANTIYWLGYAHNQPNPYICTERTFVANIEGDLPSTWTASTSYSVGQCVFNGNIIYYCIQSGTSAPSGGPTGTGHLIVDGSCQWRNVNAPFTDQGSGTITAYPVNACFPSAGWITGDRNGNPLWNGSGKRPPIFPGHNFSDLTTRSKYVPCYNINAGYATTDRPLNVYAPNQNFGGIQWGLSVTGDGADDQRIGYVNGWGVTSLYNPSDPFYLYGQIQGALCFSNYPYSYMIDERGGMPFCGNNGPRKNGKAYRNLPSVEPNWAGYNTPGRAPAFGVGNWLPWSTKYKDQCGYCGQYYVNPSHMPAAWQIAYLKTGRPCFLEQGIHMANTNCFMEYSSQGTLGSTTYYCVINTSTTQLQERAWAWAQRSLGQALYITPASHAFQPVLASYYDDNAAYQAVYYTSYVPPQAATLGFTNTLDHSDTDGKGHMAPWEHSYLFMAVAMEVWRGGLTGATSGGNWSVFLNYLNAFWKIFRANPSGLYYSGLYDLVYSPISSDLAASYQTAHATLHATYNANTNGGVDTPYPSGGLYDAYGPNCLLVNNFGENTNWYGSIMRGAMKMVAVAEPTNRTVSKMLESLVAQTSTATGISVATAGVQWYGELSGNMQNYHTYAIF